MTREHSDLLDVIESDMKDKSLSERKLFAASMIMTMFTHSEWSDMMRTGFPTAKVVTHLSPLRTEE